MADDRTLPFRERAYHNFREEMARLAGNDAGEIEDDRELYSRDERREVTILLSWGGPSDGYKLYFDKDGEAVEGYYFFADWFEYEQFKLNGDELDRVLAVYPEAAGDWPPDWQEPLLPKFR